MSKKNKKQAPLRVGITGGIGSGKTTVCRIFETLGIPVYYADERAKWLMTHDPVLMEGLKKLFGQKAFLDDGTLNRAHIASIAFNDKSVLEKLNHLVHPAVRRDSAAWYEAQTDVPYTLREAAILFESGSYKDLDKTIAVYAPKDIRIERVLQRDHTTREAVEARMSKQMPEEEKVRLADFVIYNDGEHGLIRQVLEVHRALLALADAAFDEKK